MVAKVMAKEYKIKVPEEELKKFYVENRDLITRRRAEYVLQNKDFRIATETGRLEVLNQMLVEVEIKNRAAGEVTSITVTSYSVSLNRLERKLRGTKSR